MKNIHDIRSALPIEITGAFIAIQAFIDKIAGPGSYWEWSAFSILCLIGINFVYTYSKLTKSMLISVFSCLGFLLWAISIDYTRFKDILVFLFLDLIPESGIMIGVYILSTLYGVIVFLFMSISES